MAKRFQFRLEQVLALRKQVEDVRVRELSQAQGHLLRIEESIRAHREQEKLFLDSFREFEQSGQFGADQVMAFCEYKDWLLRREKDYKSREQEWSKEVEKRRQAAIKASKDKRLLENLKEKKKNAHSQEVLAEEQRFLDEVSSIAFVRRDRAQRAVVSNQLKN